MVTIEKNLKLYNKNNKKKLFGVLIDAYILKSLSIMMLFNLP